MSFILQAGDILLRLTFEFIRKLNRAKQKRRKPLPFPAQPISRLDEAKVYR